MTNLLLLGSGGREHALAWKIAQSPKINHLYIAPGNAGTAQVGTNVPLRADDFEGIERFVLDHDINMVVVGPEDPLVKGIFDFFASRPALSQIPVIGPSKKGAVLEGSKDFAKAFMQRHGIPTAAYRTFDGTQVEAGCEFLATLSAPYVLKADGLCAGKGVLILPTLEEAQTALREMLGGQFGNASSRVVIEEFLSGIECSVFVLTDGRSYKILPEAKDYKRIGEGDTGLNTGGMGSVSPVSPHPNGWKRWNVKSFAPLSTDFARKTLLIRASFSSGSSIATDNPKSSNTIAAWATPKPRVLCCVSRAIWSISSREWPKNVSTNAPLSSMIALQSA